MKANQKLVYDYIYNFKSVNGYSPTVREIAKGLNTKSNTWVYEILQELKDLGYITYKKNTPRTIVILKFDKTV